MIIAGHGVLLLQLNIIISGVLSDLWTVVANCCSPSYTRLKKMWFLMIFIRRKIYFQDECGPLIHYVTNTLPLEVPLPRFAWNGAAFSFFNGWKNPLKKKLCISDGWAGVNYSTVISALRCSAAGAIHRTITSICRESETKVFEDSPGTKPRVLKCHFNNPL